MRLEEFIKEGARRHPGKLAVVAPRRTVSFADLDAMSGALAAVLVASGIRRNDRVALFMEPSWEAVVATLAVLKSGAVVSPVDPSRHAKELTSVLRGNRMRGLITGTRLAATAAAAVSASPAIEVIVLAGAGNVRAAPGCFGFEDAIGGLSQHVPAHGGTDLDDALVLRSSGTVDTAPDGTVTHRTAVATTESVARSFTARGDEIVTSALPLFAEPGLYRMLAAISLGATFVLERSPTIPAVDGVGEKSPMPRHGPRGSRTAAGFVDVASTGTTPNGTETGAWHAAPR